jgi:hypothetical protein
MSPIPFGEVARARAAVTVYVLRAWGAVSRLRAEKFPTTPPGLCGIVVSPSLLAVVLSFSVEASATAELIRLDVVPSSSEGAPFAFGAFAGRS